MSPLERAFRGKTVLVTGHTGFKGGWLCVWLKTLGARIVGFSLPPQGRPSFFDQAGVANGIVSLHGDIRDQAGLEAAFAEHRPEVVFHLAAQPLVRLSYREPVETFSTNVLGTAHLLEAVRRTTSVRAAVIVTSDKCYENPEDGAPRTENDPMGGHDPYSASKGAAELVVSSYRRAFFAEGRTGIASARAGNVIGGGDWAEDRIIPDSVRALAAGRQVVVRNPLAIRPWQHVLEPLSGYLWLAARLLEEPAGYSGGWNFGPGDKDPVTVRDLVAQALQAWGAAPSLLRESPDPTAVHEASTLVLDPSKAAQKLGWRATYTVAEAVARTMAWYKESLQPAFDGDAFTRRQIDSYTKTAASECLPWACEAVAKAR